MSALTLFLDRLLTTGEARLTGRPEPDDRRDTDEILRRAFAEYRLNVAGPLIEFDPDAAHAAALFTARACWFAVSREEPPEQVTTLLPTISEPMAPAAHLSIDLTLRYAVTVYRRVRAQNAEDVLAIRLADTFRRCPLTGVLSDAAEAPTGGLVFGGHAGLELLYAERLAANFRAAWLPAAGRLRERVELVFQQLGKRLPETARDADDTDNADLRGSSHTQN
jgi:metal-sulfur cluster biosynthetic enzyme